MPYVGAPAWWYFPQSDAPPPSLARVAIVFSTMGSWFETSFWPPIDASGEKIQTKHITQHLESHLELDVPHIDVGDGLRAGWNVETRDDYPRIPLLYGENGKPLYGVDPDAIHASADGKRWALLEIEGGGAVTNNRLMKDVVETLLIPKARHLALAVPRHVHGRSPYEIAVNLVQAMYGRGIPQQHVDGIMIIGY